MIDGDPERDAPQPHSEPGGVGEEVEIPERPEKGVLGDVIDIVGPNERQGERVHHALISSDELTKRVARPGAAQTGLGDERSVGLAVGSVFGKRQWV